MTRLNPRTPPATARGVTLIELLVVILIITLLATAATPVFIARINESRLATARLEVEEIAKAQQLCALAHGVYVPIQVLDDLPLPPGGVTPPSGRDDVQNSSTTSVFLTDITRSALVQSLSNGQADMQDAAAGNSAAPFFEQAQRTYFGWRGPFLNPNRVWVGIDGILDLSSDTDARFDHPLDPWGAPYRFFSPVGIIGAGASSIDRNSYSTNGFSDGRVTTTLDRFDRYAIVSLGPDGAFGAISNLGDDIVYLFGIDPNESTFSF